MDLPVAKTVLRPHLPYLCQKEKRLWSPYRVMVMKRLISYIRVMNGLTCGQDGITSATYLTCAKRRSAGGLHIIGS